MPLTKVHTQANKCRKPKQREEIKTEFVTGKLGRGNETTSLSLPPSQKKKKKQMTIKTLHENLMGWCVVTDATAGTVPPAMPSGPCTS